jgi:mannitol-1-phosphate 5-dehydrogenase
MSKKVVLFGSGATGRGHVGLLAWQAGYGLVLVDKKPGLIERLLSTGRYTVRLYGEAEHPGAYQEFNVTGYRAYNSLDRQAIAAEIVEADLVLTAVFDQNLPDVAQTLAMAVTACRQAGRERPLNCIACENMMDSSSALGKHVLAILNAEDLSYASRMFGFPDCMISRVVPRPEPDPLVIVTEDYNEWTVRAEAFKGLPPSGFEALELVENQTARLERKLFIHNGGHAICGYVGFHRGHRYIHEAVGDGLVGAYVLGALQELGEIVRRKHGFSAESIESYKQDLVRRGAIAELRDEVSRVVRDPIRKLSPRERLVAPALLAVEYGLPRLWIVKGIVAALKYEHPADLQSVLLSNRLKAEGLQPVLADLCGIPPDSPLSAEIQVAWEDWRL